MDGRDGACMGARCMLHTASGGSMKRKGLTPVKETVDAASCVPWMRNSICAQTAHLATITQLTVVGACRNHSPARQKVAAGERGTHPQLQHVLPPIKAVHVQDTVFRAGGKRVAACHLAAALGRGRDAQAHAGGVCVGVRA